MKTQTLYRAEGKKPKLTKMEKTYNALRKARLRAERNKKQTATV